MLVARQGCGGLARRGPPPARPFDGAQHERSHIRGGQARDLPLRGMGTPPPHPSHPLPLNGGRDRSPAPPLQRGALCVRRGVMGVGGRWVCRGSCLRRNDGRGAGMTGWRGAGLPPLALRRSSARASPHPGRAGTRPAPTGEGEGTGPRPHPSGRERCVCDGG